MFFPISLSNFDASKEVKLDVSPGGYGLAYFGFLHSAGTGATVQPTISERSGCPAGGGLESDKYAPSATTAKSTANQTQFDPPIPILASPDPAAKNGAYIYFKPNVNAGANNVASGLIVLVPLGTDMGTLT